MLELITDQSKLAAAIKGIKARGVKLDSDIQLAGLSAIAIVAQHGNVHYVNSLYLALGKGARHAALTAWLTTFGGVTANTASDKDTKPFNFDKSKVINLDGAEAAPWFSFKPSPAPDEVLDYLKGVMSAIKKAPKEGQAVAHQDLRDRIAILINDYNEEQEKAMLEAAAQA